MSDADLEELSGLKRLESLNLKGTVVTDIGLKHLSGLSQLQSLRLGRTEDSDAGAKPLIGFQNLTSPHLPARVTEAVIGRLREALPAAVISASRGPL